MITPDQEADSPVADTPIYREIWCVNNRFQDVVGSLVLVEC